MSFTQKSLVLHLPTSKSFRFLFVGGTIRRKGFDRVLNAYLSEFTEDDDVCLVIKDMGADSFYRFENIGARHHAGFASGLHRPSFILTRR